MNGYPWLVQFARSLLSGPETMPPALLLAGQKGLGKVDLARAIAGAALCESRERGVHACGECSACVWFRAGNHPDFRLLEPEPEADAEESRGEVEEQSERKEKKASTQITIQQIRDLAQFVNLTSHRDGYRVVLLHPAETMNANAANALLKTLEEPPARTLFVLVTHHPGRLLPTLLSRCRIVKIGFLCFIGAKGNNIKVSVEGGQLLPEQRSIIELVEPGAIDPDRMI